jgi:glycosyltransferase involved in cell wall biosynthesis
LIDPGAVVVVVPCFNEERRLDLARFKLLAAEERIHLLFVDDGSVDGTLPTLRELAACEPRVEVLALDANRGKGEAVRRGLLHAVDEGATAVGYYDADLATPPEEMLRLIDVLLAEQDLRAVLAARVSLLGSEIERSPFRHYAGRVFASIASVACGLRVYDTQCGAKLFRVDNAFRCAVESEFRSRWSFDVELLSRLVDAAGAESDPGRGFLEVPLQRWVDVPGSKLTTRSMAEAGLDLLWLWFRRRRTAARRQPAGRRRSFNSSAS